MPIAHAFLAYAPENEAAVEQLAVRLRGDARLSFWFRPWHSVPGAPIAVQMQKELQRAQSCVVFLGGGAVGVEGWQGLAAAAAIQQRVDHDPLYRVIPVLLPGSVSADLDAFPFLALHEKVVFSSLDDARAFRRLLAGILGVPPLQLEGLLAAAVGDDQLALPATGSFVHGHALAIGISGYLKVGALPTAVRNDARDIAAALTDPAICAYPAGQVELLLDEAASGASIRAALGRLAARTGPEDTAVVYFSGHGAQRQGDNEHAFLLPVDADLARLEETTIPYAELTSLLQAIGAERLLVLLDCCHSAGLAEPKGALLLGGLSDSAYSGLARGRGRAIIASSGPEELSWTIGGTARHSLFTHFLLEALSGGARTLGDGYIRVFDLFRHVARYVPTLQDQHPIFKVAMMDEDFPVALAPANRRLASREM